MSKCLERLYNGIIKENPTFVLVLGMCPTLAVTTSLTNGLGMGLSTTAVLVLSNAIISLVRKFIPDGIRVPSFIVIIASLVTILQFMLEAYIPSLNDSLGIYIPLIVVNCIILGRAESYASKNPVLPSIFDGIGMGLGFTLALSLLGAFREFIGAGSIAGVQLFGEGSITGIAFIENLEPITIFVLAPGAFFVLAFLVAAQNKIKSNAADSKEKKAAAEAAGCAACPSASICGPDAKTTVAKADGKATVAKADGKAAGEHGKNEDKGGKD